MVVLPGKPNCRSPLAFTTVPPGDDSARPTREVPSPGPTGPRMRYRRLGASRLAQVEDVDLPVGKSDVELDVADVRILADDVRP